MKKILAVSLFLILFSMVYLSSAHASDISQKSLDELVSMRDSLLKELNAVNTAIGNRIRESTTMTTNTDIGKLKDIFPDEALAMVVRDSIGKFSIEQTVTQDQLNKVKFIALFSDEHGDFTDLTGIGYLKNLERFSLYNSMDYLGKEFPEEFYLLTNLHTIEVASSALAHLSESLGNLINLRELDIRGTEVAALPESIGNLTKLRTLDIGYTKITSLPDSIWGLTLDRLDMSGLPMK